MNKINSYAINTSYFLDFVTYSTSSYIIFSLNSFSLNHNLMVTAVQESNLDLSSDGCVDRGRGWLLYMGDWRW